MREKICYAPPRPPPPSPVSCVTALVTRRFPSLWILPTTSYDPPESKSHYSGRTAGFGGGRGSGGRSDNANLPVRLGIVLRPDSIEYAILNFLANITRYITLILTIVRLFHVQYRPGWWNQVQREKNNFGYIFYRGNNTAAWIIFDLPA